MKRPPRGWFERSGRSRRHVVALLTLAGVALTALVGCGREPAPGPAPASFQAETAQLVSPDLALAVAQTRGLVREGYTDFAVQLECREPAGCHAELELAVTFMPGPYRTVLAGPIDVADGGSAWFSRPLRPSPAVTTASRIDVRVVRSFPPGAAAGAEVDEF